MRSLERIANWDLRICIRMNRVCYHLTWRVLFRCISVLGDGIVWYALMAVLLLQRIGQVSLVVRVVAVFAMVAAVLLTGHTLDAIALGRIEIAAAAIGLLIALGGLIHQMRSERQSMSRSLPAGSASAHLQAGPRDASIAPWVGWRSLRFAGHAYFSIVLMLLVGTDVMTALVARCLGAEATAAFGFVVRLVEMARRYLPMDLFWGVVRPAAIGRY